MSEHLEELEELEELENEEASSEDEEEPKPIWEQRGFSSLEEMVSALDAETESAKTVASRATEIIKQQSRKAPPVFKQDEYEERGEAYLQEYHKAVQDHYSQSVTEVPAGVLDATTEGVLKAAEKQGHDREVFYGMMRSIAKGSPELQLKARTVEGILEIGRLAQEKMDVMMGKKKEVPAEHKTVKGGRPSGPSPKASKKSEIEQLEAKIKEAGQAGRIDEVIDLTLKKQAALLSKQRGG